MHHEPLGRAELLRTATDRLAHHHGLLLHGPPGIGRTTVLAALADRAEASGATVLRCSPAHRERSLPHLGLIDLLSGLPDADSRTAALPARPRAALRTALLRAGAPQADTFRLALRVALTELLTSLAAEGPLLLAVDDLQWLDTPTAELLTHLAHRADRIGLRLLAAERTAEGEAPALPHRCPPDAAVLPVPPLDPDAITRILAARHPAGPHLPAVRRTAAGNPRYALDLARTPQRLGPAEGLTVPPDLRELLLHRARRLSHGARRALLLAAAAEHPTLALLHSASAGLGAPLGAEQVEAAARAGLFDVEADGGVRFRHPVLPAALLSDATLPERTAAHRALAGTVTEPVPRARHLALARREPDASLADLLTEAARLAHRQGAPDRAHELAALAAARTPADDRAGHRERLLQAAEYACAAGQHDQARKAAFPIVESPRRSPTDGNPGPTQSPNPNPDPGPTPEQRTRARLVLLECLGQALDGGHALIREGLAETVGHPELAARLWHWAAARELLGGRTADAARHATRAAELGGPSPTGAAALGLLATVQALRGDPASAVHTAGRARALAAATGAPATVRAELARRHALIELDEDRPTIARHLLAHADPARHLLAHADPARQVLAHADPARHLLAHADPAHADPARADATPPDLAALLAQVRIDVRTGRCAEALAAADRCGHPGTDGGTGPEAGGLPAPALYARALAELAGGEVSRARESAARAVAGAGADGDRIFQVRALEALARAELLDGSPAAVARAAEALGSACEADTGMELTGSAAVRRRALLAEALILLGDLTAADRTLAAVRRPASTPQPLAVARAEGLLLAALGRAGEGAGVLRATVGGFRERGLPLDAAETLIALATVERRARRRAAARTALAEAAALCALHGAAPLAERAARESARLGAGEAVEGGPTAVLTATEHRVADLVAQGATNREVASALFLSVKTVEGTLSRVYRKLGVRSRISLARALATATQA